ncbi:hypothetical protein P3W45_000165 [Vairimorpha bombi]
MNQLIDLKDARQWYQLCEIIPQKINQDNCEDVFNIFIENVFQYHPISLTKCALSISRYYSIEKACDLLDKSISSIKDSSMYIGDFQMQVIHLEIQKYILLLENGNTTDVEKMIFEYKKIEMDTDVYNFYNFMAYKYYESTHNYEYCVRYLLEYVKMTNDVQYMEILAKYSLISKNFFNFVEVFSLESFNKINQDLYRTYVAVQEGNTKIFDEYKILLEKMFSDRWIIVREKAYFIGLINLCFKQDERKISFKVIQDELKISEGDINSFLLKAFGLNLLKGWIDGHNKLLYFNTIIPRCLPKEELVKMMSKYDEWRIRVEKAIKMVEK